MDTHGFGLREFSFPADTAREYHPIPVKGYGIAVIQAPADASPELHIGTQDTDVLPMLPGMGLRTPVPFGRLYLSNTAGAGGVIRFVVATEPDAAVLLGGVGDVTLGGQVPSMVPAYEDGRTSPDPALAVATFQQLYNGTGFDTARGAVNGIALSAALRTTTTQSPAFYPFEALTLFWELHISALTIGASPSMRVDILDQDGVHLVYGAPFTPYASRFRGFVGPGVGAAVTGSLVNVVMLAPIAMPFGVTFYVDLIADITDITYSLKYTFR